MKRKKRSNLFVLSVFIAVVSLGVFGMGYLALERLEIVPYLSFTPLEENNDTHSLIFLIGAFILLLSIGIYFSLLISRRKK